MKQAMKITADINLENHETLNLVASIVKKNDTASGTSKCDCIPTLVACSLRGKDETEF
jgi:hypothetical protein